MKDIHMTANAEIQHARVQQTPSERHETLVAANVKAKTLFSDKYEGASIRVKTVMHNRSVIRAFKRIFNISMRNWYIATTVPRSSPGNAGLASQVEQGMIKKINEASEFFKKKITLCEHIATEAEIDFGLISHGKEYVDDTRVIGPVAMQLRDLFLKADRYLDLTSALYSFGHMDSDAASNASFDVKKHLEATSTSIRNFRRLALEKVNDSGKARPGFKSVDVEGENAGQESAKAPSEAPSNVVGIDSTQPDQIAAEAPDHEPVLKTA